MKVICNDAFNSAGGFPCSVFPANSSNACVLASLSRNSIAAKASRSLATALNGNSKLKQIETLENIVKSRIQPPLAAIASFASSIIRWRSPLVVAFRRRNVCPILVTPLPCKRILKKMDLYNQR